jgi:uncharacterized protein (DUF983 family)
MAFMNLNLARVVSLHMAETRSKGQGNTAHGNGDTHAHPYKVSQMPAIAAMLGNRCPRCREGKVFKYPALDYVHFREINDNCQNCGLHFEPEPGFYQLAMYASYGNQVALIVICFFAVYILMDNPSSEWVYIGITIGISFLLAPLNYRFSRLMVLYWFGGHRYAGKRRVKN